MAISNAYKVGFALLIGAFLAFSLSACSKDYDIEIGRNIEGTSQIVITNQTGASVTSLECTTDNTVTDITQSILDSSKPWENGRKARVSFTASNYITILIAVNGSTYIIHDAELLGVEKATLKLDGEFAYLEYEKDGKTLSTLEYDKAVKATQA